MATWCTRTILSNIGLDTDDPGFVVTAGQRQANAGSIYQIWYSNGAIYLWLNGNLVYADDPFKHRSGHRRPRLRCDRRSASGQCRFDLPDLVLERCDLPVAEWQPGVRGRSFQTSVWTPTTPASL